MRVGVFGPRDYPRGKKYTNYNHVADKIATYDATCITSGGGIGVEQLALRFAEENGIQSKVVPPHIQALGTKVAFEKRNEEIARQIEIAVVFWDGKEKYYAELIGKLIGMGVDVHVYNMGTPASQ